MRHMPNPCKHFLAAVAFFGTAALCAETGQEVSPETKKYFVVSDKLRVRAQAGPEGDVLYSLKKWDMVRTFASTDSAAGGQKEGWLAIEASTGVRGWVSEKLLYPAPSVKAGGAVLYAGPRVLEAPLGQIPGGEPFFIKDFKMAKDDNNTGFISPYLYRVRLSTGTEGWVLASRVDVATTSLSGPLPLLPDAPPKEAAPKKKAAKKPAAPPDAPWLAYVFAHGGKAYGSGRFEKGQPATLIRWRSHKACEAKAGDPFFFYFSDDLESTAFLATELSLGKGCGNADQYSLAAIGKEKSEWKPLAGRDVEDPKAVEDLDRKIKDKGMLKDWSGEGDDQFVLPKKVTRYTVGEKPLLAVQYEAPNGRGQVVFVRNGEPQFFDYLTSRLTQAVSLRQGYYFELQTADCYGCGAGRTGLFRWDKSGKIAATNVASPK